MSTRRFTEKEFSRISLMMQNHHSLFYEMWKLGKPIFSDIIPTACIRFNNEGTAHGYYINPEYWDSRNDQQKCFIIGHEQLHSILNQGIRANVKIDSNANRAMDLVVNHMLVDSFGFDRSVVDPENEYCWIDTVFINPPEPIKEHESFEYYSKMINRYCKNKSSVKLVDFHELMEDSSDFLKHFAEELSDEIKDQLKDFIQKHLPKIPIKAGDATGGMEYLVKTRKAKPKRKWETVIKRWMHKVLTVKDKDAFQWSRINRRFSLIKSEMSIPSEMEMSDHFRDDRKILVWFFQDTSGSCADFMDRFFTAAESLPKDRFDVKMHCFDTNVYETTLESRTLKGFGGTSFKCIEDYIQGYCHENNCKYPAAVFVVTDGAGNTVCPQYPKNWYWFLSSPYYSFIPEKSYKFLLSDYE